MNSESEIIFPSIRLMMNPYIGSNSSPVFLNKQTEIYRLGNTIIHEPFAFDAEGDSLVFSLAPATSSKLTFPVGSLLIVIPVKLSFRTQAIFML
ncbi:MAG: hypothetical protein IPP27_15685 [Bacteroidetes bacterium]|nr:hypothetical protein [Bacteroidota bacterium]